MTASGAARRARGVSKRDPKPAYLIAGDDEAKIDATLRRLRARAEGDGGAGALETFSPPAGSGAPDLEGLIAAIPMISLTASRRYLLADRLERAAPKQISALAEALAGLPPDLSVVLVERPPGGRERPNRARAAARKALLAAIEAAGGEVREFRAPAARELPRHLVAEARKRGFELEPEAARLLGERMDGRMARLANELDRLALWAGPEGRVTADDLAEMVADTSEEAAWTLADGLVGRDSGRALAAAERLAGQGETPTALIWQAAKRLRAAERARELLDAGRPAREVERELEMHPYAARMLVRSVSGVPLAELRAATCALADLEWWTRGGSDYPEDVAVTVALRRAAGVA
jgi:DNA polymerase III subunit delta